MYTTDFTTSMKCKDLKTSKVYYVGSYINRAGREVQGLYNGHTIPNTEGLSIVSCTNLTTNIIQVPDVNKRMARYDEENDDPKQCFNEFKACVGNLQKLSSSNIVRRIYRYRDGARKTTAYISKSKFTVRETSREINKYMVFGNKQDLPSATFESIEIKPSEFAEYSNALLMAIETKREKAFMNMFRKEKVKKDYVDIKDDIFKLVRTLDQRMQMVHQKFVTLYGLLKRYGDNGSYSMYPINRFMVFVNEVMRRYFVETNSSIFFYKAESEDKTKTYTVVMNDALLLQTQRGGKRRSKCSTK